MEALSVKENTEESVPEVCTYNPLSGSTSSVCYPLSGSTSSQTSPRSEYFPVMISCCV